MYRIVFVCKIQFWSAYEAVSIVSLKLSFELSTLPYFGFFIYFTFVKNSGTRCVIIVTFKIIIIYKCIFSFFNIFDYC